MNFGRGKQVKQELAPMLIEPAEPPLSETYAIVAEKVKRLEARLQDALLKAQQQENRAAVAEQMLDEAKHLHDENLHSLRGENTHLMNERDKYQRDYLDIKARLDAVAAMLLGPLKEEQMPVAIDLVQEKGAPE